MMAQRDRRTTLRTGPQAAGLARQRLLVTGVVQGVGFRPHVYGLATRLGLAGFVGNDSSGVFIELEGPPAALTTFQQELVAHPPPLAHIEAVATTPLPPTGAHEFTIVHSEVQPAARTLISPDLAVCEECLRELFDPADRRYRYPFINCTNCGPRFTIVRDLPYDRPFTTMADFSLCPACRREYEDPRNRRFHAQPNACPVCGPWVEFCGGVGGGEWGVGRGNGGVGSGEWGMRSGEWGMGNGAILAAQWVLVGGGVVAVKGIGGFHLACDATNDHALKTLRERKGRVDKPFALMVRDVETVRRIAYINDAELALLTGRERPIVLLRKREGGPLSALVTPGNGYIGVMLPYSPLHHLLLNPPDSPLPTPHSPLPMLVMTSGNYADEPIVKENGEALEHLAGLADAFLLHNRAIHVHCDDSVIRVVEGHELPIRRSRGYAPFPVRLPFAVPPVLAVGGELKSTFCLAQDKHAFLSQHIGDMQNLETLHAFERAVEQMQAIFRISPEIIACDLHPGYLSTRWAEEHAGGRTLVKVQHHHAHIASVMAENGTDGSTPVIGFSFDGTGYGSDGAIWGGEVLVADYQGFRRVAHLKYFPLPGGDVTIRRPYRTALAALWAAGETWHEALPPVAASSGEERGVIQRQLETGLNTVPTSSMGRLFDAVAALAGVRQIATYEAQAAIEFEALIDEHETTAYHFDWQPSTGEFNPAPLLHAVAADVRAGVAAPVIAARFHNAVADLVLTLSLWLREGEGLNQVALSGGVFQNVTLLQLTRRRLRTAGFDVLTHRLVPPNDGGLALGQAAIAGFCAADGRNT
jgi:hydrogenase maturation protein HypF